MEQEPRRDLGESGGELVQICLAFEAAPRPRFIWSPGSSTRAACRSGSSTPRRTLKPAGQEANDYGHWDLWLADNAAKLVWRPILDWLKKH
jgi:hypothetical protein